MEQFWLRFEKWLSENSPEHVVALNAGVSDNEISQAEETLGVSIPDAYKEFLQIHNGQEYCDLGLFGDWHILSLEEAIEVREMLEKLRAVGEFEFWDDLERSNDVKNGWWNPK